MTPTKPFVVPAPGMTRSISRVGVGYGGGGGGCGVPVDGGGAVAWAVFVGNGCATVGGGTRAVNVAATASSSATRVATRSGSGVAAHAVQAANTSPMKIICVITRNKWLRIQLLLKECLGRCVVVRIYLG